MINWGKFFIVFGVASILMFAYPVFAQVDQQAMDASADQAQGNYAPMNMDYAGFNSLGMTQAAWLDPLQNLGEGQSRPAYSRYYWSPDLVLPIRVREGMITLLNFPEWEMIEDIFIGDNATFDGQISGPNTLLLYPRKGANVGVDTNIIVFGRSGNRYVFYIRSEAVNTERLTNAIIDIDVIGGGSGSASGSGGGRGIGSGGKSIDSTYTRRMQKDNWIQHMPLDPTKFRFDLEVYVPNPDDVVIAPERVWRDDIFTYIDLGKKSLNMIQRPVVSMIVERGEFPVGFRSTGPHNRLIIVEGIGDMVLRNGKRLVCVKLRRTDTTGLEYAINAADEFGPQWDIPAPLPQGNKNADTSYMGYSEAAGGMGSIDERKPWEPQGIPAQYDIQAGSSEIIVPQYGQGGANVNINYNSPAVQGNVGNSSFDYSKMQRISNSGGGQQNAYLQQYGYGSGFRDGNANISIELGTDADVGVLESLWDNISGKYSKDLKNYEPFFSVDAAADGQGKELFHLRIGPVNSLEEGDHVCSKLGRDGIFCSVVRTQ